MTIMFTKHSVHKAQSALLFSAISSMLYLIPVSSFAGVPPAPTPSPGGSSLSLSGSGLTGNQIAAGATIDILCPRNIVGAQLQDRCNALIDGRAQGSPPSKAGTGTAAGSVTDAQLSSILGSVTSEQTAAQGTNAVEMANNQQGNIGARFAAIRQGRQGGLNISGLMLRDSHGNLLSKTELDKLSSALNPLAAGDGSSVFDRLGIFVNGSIDIGDRNTTLNEIGFGVDQYGTTAGIDYRFTDNFIMGAAFGFQHADTEYASSLGSMDSDSFSGSLYGTFYTDNGFYIDGIFSGSSLKYETRRNIEYTVSAGSTVLDAVRTTAFGNNEGREYNASLNGGYNFNFGGLTLTPQARVEYINTQIDALNETGGRGWALHIDEQEINSLTSALGGQAAYPFSFTWGVLIPTLRAEWVHEFMNGNRTITAHFMQDPSKTRFNILTDSPDRDFMYLGAGLSAQFTHGISAFVNYETLLAHKFASNHSFTGGVRFELDF